MTQNTENIFNGLLSRHPSLSACRESILSAFGILRDAYAGGNKLLIAGNGGSAADAEHIAAELMKSFLIRREIPGVFRESLISAHGDEGGYIAGKLEGALPAVSLTGFPALTTAFGNDVDPELSFAQLVYALGAPGDVLLGISTSGGARNVRYALKTARCRGMKTIGLTGLKGGGLSEMCDAVIIVPDSETYAIQELHLPVYHALCAMLESEFFGGPDKQ